MFFYSIDLPVYSCIRLFLLMTFSSVFLNSKIGDNQYPSFSGTTLGSILLIVVSAFIWTMIVSYDLFYTKLLLLVLGCLLLGIIRKVRFDDFFSYIGSSVSKPQDVNFWIGHSMLLLWVLVFRGWLFLIFTACALSLIFVAHKCWPDFLGRFTKLMQFTLFFPLVFFSAFIARQFVQPYSSTFWTSYDQIFRGSISTGLTRWGYTDINFASGYALKYHWLGESVSGFLTRMGSVSEFDSISRLSPMLGISLVILGTTAFARTMELNAVETSLVVIFVAAFGNATDLSSIGTLWGGGLFLFSIVFFKALLDNPTTLNCAFLSILISLTTLAQSLYGFSLGASILLLSLYFLVEKTLTVRPFLFIFVFISSILIAIQIFLFSTRLVEVDDQGFGFDNWLRFPGVQIQIGGSLDSGPLAVRLNSFIYILGVLSTFSIIFGGLVRRGLETFWAKWFVSLSCVSIILISTINLGEFNVKLWAPIGLAGTLLASGVSLKFISRQSVGVSAHVALILILVGVSFFTHFNLHVILINFHNGILKLLLMVFCFLVCGLWLVLYSKKSTSRMESVVVALSCFVVSLFFVPIIDSIKHGRIFQDSYSMTGMFGGPNIDDCLGIIRENTPSDAVIASNLWGIPGSGEEKYFLVSLYTQRRVLIDGPLYSKGVDWPSVNYFESLKNTHTDFGNTVDPRLGVALKSLGAEYFIFDTRLPNPDRTWTEVAGYKVLVSNSECSVIEL